MLHQYVYCRKNGKKHKKGVLFADKMADGTLSIGFSSCSPLDEFDRDFGIEVAMDRSYKYYWKRPPKRIPVAIQNNLLDFICRCQRYFKPSNYTIWMNDYVIEKLQNCYD